MSKQTIPPVEVIDLGLMPYGEALKLQENVHAEVVGGRGPVILLVEHPPVLTMGKNSDQANLLLSREDYRTHGIDFYETDRGGEVTAHVPGQLVVYPIVPLVRANLGIKSYVCILERCVIDTLASYNIEAAGDAEYPGVWIGHAKICAIGVRVKSRVTMHGLALNVNNSLDLFAKIVPCGIRQRSATTMKQVLGRDIDFSEVKLRMSRQLQMRLGESFVKKLC